MDGRVKHNWIVVGALWGALGIVLGAFGAHWVKERVDPEGLGWWETATLYHLVSAGAVVLAGMLGELRGRASRSAPTFLAGALVFSGTLYAMALGAPRVLGAVTPLGGLLLIIGWVLMAREARRPPTEA